MDWTNSFLVEETSFQFGEASPSIEKIHSRFDKAFLIKQLVPGIENVATQIEKATFLFGESAPPI